INRCNRILEAINRVNNTAFSQVEKDLRFLKAQAFKARDNLVVQLETLNRELALYRVLVDTTVSDLSIILGNEVSELIRLNPKLGKKPEVLAGTDVIYVRSGDAASAPAAQGFVQGLEGLT